MKKEIKVVNTSSLKENPNNKKIYDTDGKVYRDGIESLKISISSMGLLEPLVVNENNILLSGHRRLQALKELGIKKCEVRFDKVDKENELKMLVHQNRQRVKSDEEFERELNIITEELLKQRKMGRPKKGSDTKPKGSIRKQVAETMGVSEGKIQNFSRSRIELEEIKKKDKNLYNKVKNSTYKDIKEAHNKVMADINMVKEFKGAFTRKEKRGLKKDFNILMDRYKPPIDELYVLMKERWTFTLDDKLKELIK